MPTVAYDTHEWIKMHGGNPLRVGCRVLLPDGAMTDESDAVRHEPPGDPYARLRRRKDYAAEALRRTESDFKRLKGAMMGFGIVHSSSLYTKGLPAYGIEALQHLKEVADEQRSKLAQLEQEVAATPEGRERRRREEAEKEMQAEAASQAAGLEAQARAINL